MNLSKHRTEEQDGFAIQKERKRGEGARSIQNTVCMNMQVGTEVKQNWQIKSVEDTQTLNQKILDCNTTKHML
jgi:hypothetical protein